VYSGRERVLVLHPSDVCDLDVYEAGLTFIAAVVPTPISTPLTGALADNKGTELVQFLGFPVALPWWGVVAPKDSSARFLAIIAFESEISLPLAVTLWNLPLGCLRSVVHFRLRGVFLDARVCGGFNLVHINCGFASFSFKDPPLIVLPDEFSGSVDVTAL